MKIIIWDVSKFWANDSGKNKLGCLNSTKLRRLSSYSCLDIVDPNGFQQAISDLNIIIVVLVDNFDFNM